MSVYNLVCTESIFKIYKKESLEDKINEYLGNSKIDNRKYYLVEVEQIPHKGNEEFNCCTPDGLMAPVSESRLFPKENVIIFLKSRDEQIGYEQSIKSWLSKKNFKYLTYDQNNGIKELPFSESDKAIISSEVPVRFPIKNEDVLKQMSEMPVPLLLLGERGTGKTTSLDFIHAWKKQKGIFHKGESKIVKVQCGNIPKGLETDFFFGHVKGAFTGATAETEGRIKEADNGILFLDEIQDLSKEMQRIIIETLRTGKYYKVGDQTKEYESHFQLVCASNRSFEELLQKLDYDFFDRVATFKFDFQSLRSFSSEEKKLVWNSCWRKHYNNIKKHNVKTAFPEIPLEYEKVGEYIENSELRGNCRDIERLIDYIDMLYYNSIGGDNSNIPNMAIIKESCGKWKNFCDLRDNTERKNSNTPQKTPDKLFQEWIVSESADKKMSFEELLKSKEKKMAEYTDLFKQRFMEEALKFGEKKEIAKWLNVAQKTIGNHMKK